MLGLMKRICPHRKKLTHQYPSVADENRLSSPIEASAGRWVDYLLARGDVDPSRIALFGDGLGGSLAIRIAAAIIDLPPRNVTNAFLRYIGYGVRTGTAFMENAS
jgi:dienelactone hydrolase